MIYLKKLSGWQFYDKIAGKNIYKDEIDKLDPKRMYDWTLGTERELIRNSIQDKEIILDIGCGTGRSCLFFADDVDNIIGIDASPKMINIANNKKERLGISNIKFLIENAEKLSFQDDFFDSVILCGTLAEVENPEKILREAYRVLKKDGIIIIVEINWEKAFKDDSKGDKVFYSLKNGDIGLYYVERTINPSREKVYEGILKKGTDFETFIKNQLKEKREVQISPNYSLDYLQNYCSEIEYREIIQFTINEVNQILHKNKFANITIKGYSLLYDIIKNENLIEYLSPYMNQLCKSEALFCYKEKLEESEMLFVTAIKK